MGGQGPCSPVCGGGKTPSEGGSPLTRAQGALAVQSQAASASEDARAQPWQQQAARAAPGGPLRADKAAAASRRYTGTGVAQSARRHLAQPEVLLDPSLG
jgi:hypothetical protein